MKPAKVAGAAATPPIVTRGTVMALALPVVVAMHGGNRVAAIREASMTAPSKAGTVTPPDAVSAVSYSAGVMQSAGAVLPPALVFKPVLSGAPRPVTYNMITSESAAVERILAGLACVIGAYVGQLRVAALPCPSWPSVKTP